MSLSPVRPVRPASRAAFAVALAFLLVAPSCGEAKPAAPAAPAASPAAIPESGPSKPAETLAAAYDKGLDFLASKQKAGIWASAASKGAPDPAFTSMALTAMIERPGGVRPKDRPTIDAGLAFVAQCFEDDGGVASPQYRNYMTAVMVMALAASKKDEYRPLVAKGAEFIKKLQFLDEGNPTYGGIGYGSDNTRGDLSNTQYALASLRAAGVPASDPVFQRAVTYLSRTQNRKENETAGEPAAWQDPKANVTLVRSNDGGANYYPGNSKAGFDKAPDGTGVLRSYGSMTFALLRCYHLAGLDAKDGRVQAATDWIAKNWALDRNPGMPEADKGQGQYYYYATIGKTMPLTGRTTIEAIDATSTKAIDWRAELSSHLLAAQRPDGSWINAAPRWQEADELLCTCYALTALSGCAR